jgi:hypothetical protein
VPLDRQQRIVIVSFLLGLLLVLVIVALFEPVVWLMVFPVTFILAALLDPG